MSASLRPDRRSRPLPRITVSASAMLAVVTVLLGPAAAQKLPKYKPEYYQSDPYTKNEPARMQKAGYVSFGPFAWGDDHGSADIAKMFPGIPLLFLETAHFRICSALPAYAPPKTAALEKKLLAEDLAELKQVFPEIKTGLRQLDPWLRLHLSALRLERTYARFSAQIGVTDADFPKDATMRIVQADAKSTRSDGGAAPERKYMGQGPILGMRSKFLVMLTVKGGDLNRYVARARPGTAMGTDPLPHRFYFAKVGSLFFGTACECGQGSLFNDHALHCHLVFNTVQSLVDGYKDFFFSLPVWLREGLSHWHLRNIDPKEHCFTEIKGRSNRKRYESDWDVKIRKRLKHDDFTTADKVMKFMAFTDLTFGDHMAVWSRVDFLLSLGHDKFGRFLGLLKNPIAAPAGQFPPTSAIWQQQERALQSAYGFDYAGFDAAWKAWAIAKYPDR